jgi:hypothetical protein
MADALSELELLHEIQTESDAIGRLLSAKGGFEAAFKAFREEDSKSFRSVLDRAALLIRCHYVCRWIRIKECVFLCLDLAGPPTHFERPPDPRVLATALGRLAADEKLVKRLADILEKRDRRGFLDVVKKLEIQPFAHFFCHWLCTIRYRLVCRRICTIDPPPYVLWAEIQAAAMAVGALAEDGRTFKAVAAASVVGDAAKLADLLRHPDWTWRCHYVCEYFCSWRCVLLCLTYARPFPYAAVAAAAQIREARAFAEVIAKLSENSAALEQLSAAVASGKVDRWTAIVKELKLERFALQLCHWVCGWRCYHFCRLVCPDPHFYPLFRNIGDFAIHSDIDPATGLTKWPKGGGGGHGGPNYGFLGNLTLRASCPTYDPANPGQGMSYRFLFRRPGDPAPIPITAAFVWEVYVGTRLILWNGSWKWQTIRLRGAGASPNPTPPGPSIDPPDHFIVPDPQGWVEVDPATWDSAFNGDLMGFASGFAVAGGPAAPGVAAGTAVPPANQKNGTDCEIIFQATRTSTKLMVNGGAAPDYADSVPKVRINNWDEVGLLDLLQFHSGGGTPCSPLSNALDIEYTVDHELIASWGIGLTTASGMTLTAPPPPPSSPRGGAGTHHENIAAWPTCSYKVTLTTRRRLTDGLIDDPDKVSGEKTFCIGRRH